MITVPFGDLRRQYETLRGPLDHAIREVVERGWFILGSGVEKFEKEFAAYIGVKHAIGVGSGTDAIHLALVAAGVQPGDEVITAANTCVPTVSGITSSGARAELVDCDPQSFNINPEMLRSAITPGTKAIVAVHLYGQAADMDPILEVGRDRRIVIIEDAAQAHGASYKGKRLGALGDAACFSFYPSKNLGAYGDAGAVLTNDDRIAERVRQLRNYGEKRRYYHTSRGVNSRLDEIQAAVLSVKLPHLDRWNSRRREIARLYGERITNSLIRKPVASDHGGHNYHLYVIRCRRRDELQQHLANNGVATLIHYPIPVHLQEAYRDMGKRAGDYPVAELCASEVLSLPLFPELTDEEALYVASCVNSFS